MEYLKSTLSINFINGHRGKPAKIVIDCNQLVKGTRSVIKLKIYLSN